MWKCLTGNPRIKHAKDENGQVTVHIINTLENHYRLFPTARFEPRCEKTGLRGFRPGPTQTGLYSHRRWIEA